MDKIVRALLIGLVLASATLISLGWTAYGEINAVGKTVKKEVKEEMMEIRNNDMQWIDKRFNTIEKLMVGKVVTEPRNDNP
jgi:tRNA 2-selenouridine synthase SelU